jgi:beta-glucosidase
MNLRHCYFSRKNFYEDEKTAKKEGACIVGLGFNCLLLASKPGGNDEPVSKIPIYLNTSYTFEERAADLVSRFTVEEKESLLGNNMAPVPRLGIKSYNVWSEALHGILSFANPGVGLDGPTSFPNSVALGAAWDPELIEREASAIADEARAIFATGTKGLLTGRPWWNPSGIRAGAGLARLMAKTHSLFQKLVAVL